jgi:hypothetical protein
MTSTFDISASRIVVAIALSLIGLSSQAANPRVYVIGRKRGKDVLRPLSSRHPDNETFDRLLILRPEGGCPPPQRCPYCRKWICNEQRRE